MGSSASTENEVATAAAAAAAAGGGGFADAAAVSFLVGLFVGRGFTLGGMVASSSARAAAMAAMSLAAAMSSAAASVSLSSSSSLSATSSSKKMDGRGGRRQHVRGRAQAKKLTILNALSYLRCVVHRYTRLRGPTLPNNCGNLCENSFYRGAENEGLLPARYFGGRCL